MACDLRNLRALAYANGFTMWHYKTPDHPDHISLGYFNEAASMFQVGDFIFTNTNIDDKVRSCILVVTAISGSVVTVVRIA